jgi:hypothetical protein
MKNLVIMLFLSPFDLENLIQARQQRRVSAETQKLLGPAAKEVPGESDS